MEKILLFGVTDTTYTSIKQTASRMKISYERIESAYYSCTLGAIESGTYKTAPILNQADTASGNANPSAAQGIFPQPTESLLVMCSLSDKRMDKLLFELRRADAKLDYKAVLTPTNKAWTVSQLLLEMRREKAAYQRSNS